MRLDMTMGEGCGRCRHMKRIMQVSEFYGSQVAALLSGRGCFSVRDSLEDTALQF